MNSEHNIQLCIQCVYIYPLLAKLVRPRRLEFGLVLFCACLFIGLHSILVRRHAKENLSNIQPSLTIRLVRRAHVTTQKHFGRQDGFLFSSLLFLKMLALTLTWIGPFWIISCKIVTFLVSPTPLMFCLVYLRLFSGNLLQNWLQVRRGVPKPSLVPITPGTGNKC